MQDIQKAITKAYNFDTIQQKAKNDYAYLITWQ